MRGFTARTAFGPMPRRSTTPGRNASTTTSAVAASRRNASTAAGCLRSRTTLCLLRWVLRNQTVMPFWLAPSSRVGSPACVSMRITSAPWSAIIIVRCGPGRNIDRSMTLMPSSFIESLLRKGAARRREGQRGRQRPQTAGSDLVAADQLLGDHLAQDLVRSLADDHEHRVAVEALDLVLDRQAVAAEDAHRLLRAEDAGFRAGELGHRRLEVAALAAVEHSRRALDQLLRTLDLRRHVGELQLDRLVLPDRLAESAALLRVAKRHLERALGDAGAARGDVDAAELEAAGSLHEALALDAAEQVLLRHAVVVEAQLAGVDGAVAHLLQLAVDVEARALLGDEHAHALVARLGVGVGLDQQQRHVAVQAVGDPGLRAVDDVVVAVEPGDRADRLQVGAGVRLGQAQAAAHLAGRHQRQVLPLLRFGAVPLDRRGGDEV